MNRKDAYLDAMLRHLGAAYYDSLHGKAAPSDVARALDSVAGQIGEEPTGPPADAGPDGAAAGQQERHGRWHSQVRDVMTTSVVTVDRITPYKEIARRLAERKVGGVPVLTMGRHVAGVVSEGDLLATRDQNPAAGRRRLGWPRRPRHHGTLAEDLMTSPAITIRPDATIAAAARLMNAHRVRFLPVVDPAGRLLGIVSRRDLLSVFLRPDAEIARQVREIFTDILPGGAVGIQVGVRNGVVTLTGQIELAADDDLIPIAVRLAWDVEGVVDVVDKVGAAATGVAAGR
jgi:CBS domain-containing protein